MKRLRRALKMTAIALGGAVGIAFALLLAAWGAANTDAGRDWLTARLAQTLGTPDAPAEVTGLRGPLPQRISLDRLVLRDGKGAWLTLETVELAWRPAALLSGRLEVATLRAGRVALDRLPPGEAEPAAEPDEPFSLPRPPLPIRLDELAVARVELGPAVLGQAAAFSVQGQAAAPAAGTLESRLSVRRLDDPGGRLDARASYQRDSHELALDVKAEGAAGGLLAGALNLGPDARVSASVSGHGPLDDWSGRLDATLGPGASVGLDLAVVEARRLSLQGRANVQALLPPDAAELLGGGADIAIDARREGEAGLTLEQARVTTPTVDLRLTGRLDADAGTMEASAAVELRDPAPVNALAAPASLDGITVRLDARGPLAQPDIAAEITAARVALPDLDAKDLRVTATFRPDGALARGRVEAHLRGGELVTAMPELAGFSGSAIDGRLAGRLDLDAQRITDATARLEAPDTDLRLTGLDVDLASGRGRATLDLRLADLRRIDPVMGLGLAGGAHLSGDLAFAEPGTPLRARVQGDLQSLSWSEPFLAALATGDGALETSVTLHEDSALSLSALKLETQAARLGGDLRFPGDFGTIDGAFDLALADAGVLSGPIGTDLAGRASGTAKLRGAIGDPTVEAELTIEDAAIAGAALGVVEISGTARQVASAANGRLDAKVSLTPIGPATASTDFALGDTDFRLEGLRASTDGLEISEGRLAVPLAGGALRGGAEIGVLDLAATTRHLDLPLAGRGQLTLSLQPGKRGQGARLDGRLLDPNFGDGAAKARSIDITARLDEAFGAPRGDIRLAFADAAAGPATLNTATLTADGGLDDIGLRIEADGEVFGPMRLRAAGRVKQAADTVEVTLSELAARLQGQNFALARPAVLQHGPDSLSVRDFELQAAGGTLAVNATKAGGRIDAAAELRDLPLALTRLVLAQPRLSGTLNGRIALEGALDRPGATMDLTAEALTLEEADLPPLDARIDGRLGDGRLTARGEVTGLSEAPIRLMAALPFALSVEPFAADVRPDSPVEAELTWQGEVAPLMPFVPVSGHELAGRADVALRLEGTVGDPQPRGHIALREGAYENLDTGTVLTQLSMRIEGTGEALRIVELSARDGGKGRIEATGGLDLDTTEGPVLDLNVTTRKATLVRRDEIVARTNADITVGGPLDDLLVAGLVTVDRGEARIPDDLPPDVASLDVTEVGGDKIADAPQAGEASGEQAAGADSRVRLDIAVDVPNRFFVRGGGLDTEWAGNLLVTGTAARPIVSGQLQAVRGQMDFLGKVFAIDSGLVAFDGGREIDPIIDVVALHESGDIDVTVAVAGQAQKPELTLSSVPGLPQDEILSRLLFGTNAAELTPVQAAQLAAAVAQLTAGGTGPGLLDRLRGLAGVDVLRVGSTEEGDPSVTAGKYIGQDVFVGVEQGTDTESGAAKVEVELTDNISVESRMGATGESEVGIQFKWDY